MLLYAGFVKEIRSPWISMDFDHRSSSSSLKSCLVTPPLSLFPHVFVAFRTTEGPKKRRKPRVTRRKFNDSWKGSLDRMGTDGLYSSLKLRRRQTHAHTSCLPSFFKAALYHFLWFVFHSTNNWNSVTNPGSYSMDRAKTARKQKTTKKQTTRNQLMVTVMRNRIISTVIFNRIIFPNPNPNPEYRKSPWFKDCGVQALLQDILGQWCNAHIPSDKRESGVIFDV